MKTRSLFPIVCAIALFMTLPALSADERWDAIMDGMWALVAEGGWEPAMPNPLLESLVARYNAERPWLTDPLEVPTTAWRAGITWSIMWSYLLSEVGYFWSPGMAVRAEGTAPGTDEAAYRELRLGTNGWRVMIDAGYPIIPKRLHAYGGVSMIFPTTAFYGVTDYAGGAGEASFDVALCYATHYEWEFGWNLEVVTWVGPRQMIPITIKAEILRTVAPLDYLGLIMDFSTPETPLSLRPEDYSYAPWRLAISCGVGVGFWGSWFKNRR